MTDLAVVAARFGAALHDAGVGVGADRCERFVRAVQLVRPQRTSELYRCAAATMLATPEDRPAFDRAFALVFGGFVDEAGSRGQAGDPGLDQATPGARPTSGSPGGGRPGIGDRPKDASGEA